MDCDEGGTCRIRRRRTGAIIGDPPGQAPAPAPAPARPTAAPAGVPSDDVRILAACVKAMQASVQALADAIERLPSAVAAAMRQASPPPPDPPRTSPPAGEAPRGEFPTRVVTLFAAGLVVVLSGLFLFSRRHPKGSVHA